MPSFSATVKQELVGVRIKSNDQKRAQLFGLTHTAGSLRLGRLVGIEYVTETKAVAEHIIWLATGQYEVQPILSTRAVEHRKLPLWTVTLTGPGGEALLTEAGLFARTGQGVDLIHDIPEAVQADAGLRRAFLRGAFLGAGSVSRPASAYHLELVCRNDTLAQAVCEFLAGFDCEAKRIPRKERIVVYLKDGDRIAAFLALMGASVATLKFEQVRTEKHLRNYINRTSNCETANIGKTVNAAGDQIDAIHRIFADPAAQKRLSPVLRETAELRLNYPDASLAELAGYAGIGKSGMNNRLQRLLAMAEKL